MTDIIGVGIPVGFLFREYALVVCVLQLFDCPVYGRLVCVVVFRIYRTVVILQSGNCMCGEFCGLVRVVEYFHSFLPDFRYIPYHFGGDIVRKVVKKGATVWEREV